MVDTWDEFSERVRDLETREIAPDLSSVFMALPGLRGLWLTSPSGSAGQAFDLSGNGRTLTYNGNPVYNTDNLVPYIALDGIGDWLSRADEAGLDIIGTETYVDSSVQGLTMGGWFWFDNLTVATSETCIGKWLPAGNQRSYIIRRDPGGLFRSVVSGDGLVTIPIGSQVAFDDRWLFGTMRFDPGTELAMFAGGSTEDTVGNPSFGLVKSTLTVGIPATIFNGTGDLRIGADGGGAELITGRASLCWLCAAYLSDSIIESIFEQTRGAFGV